MSGLKILVVEDEIVIADNICLILEQLGYNVLEPAINYSEAIETINSENPDLCILDIQLAGSKDGIDLAWKIKEDYNIPFIFLTSNADPRTIERAKKLAPPAYLVKPFNRDDLYTSIEIALYNSREKADYSDDVDADQIRIKDAFFIKDKHLFHKVKYDDILFAKSDHVYIEIFTTDGKKHLIRSSMNDFEQSLPDQFFRTHRSYTINLEHLDAINSLNVVIQDYLIPIGKTYRSNLLKVIQLK